MKKSEALKILSFHWVWLWCDIYNMKGERPMQKLKWQFESSTGLGNIYTEVWIPEGKPQAVLQIAHGMAEHIGRYAHFASFLVEKNCVVVMNDHAGHGKSIHQKEHRGYFGEKDGWRNVIRDLKTLHNRVADEFSGVPMILLGHSMGSFLARAYAMIYPRDYDAYIFSGTAGKNPVIGVGRLVAKFERWKNGAMKESKRLKKMSTGSYNESFKKKGVKGNWLTSVEEVVAEYEKDPFSGFAFTAEAMLDLFGVMKAVTGEQWAKKVPEAPIYLFSGDQDPVGAKGKGVRQVISWLEKTGHQDVSYRLYEGGRHEMLNEVNRLEVYEDIWSFLSRINASSKAV